MVYFISGHRNISEENFKKYYTPKIDKVLKDDPDPWFLIGDYEGADYLAQKYLSSIGKGDLVRVYHMFSKPRNCVEGLKCIGGFTTDEERDAAMTKDSDFDIAYFEKERKWSGTLTNIIRRWGILIVCLLCLFSCDEGNLSQSYNIQLSYSKNGIIIDTCFTVYPPSNFPSAPEVEENDKRIKVIYLNRYQSCFSVLKDGPIIDTGKVISFKSIKGRIKELPNDRYYWRKTYKP